MDDPATEQTPIIRRLSMHAIAASIRALDSELVRIESHALEDEQVLTYVFRVAGKEQAFHIVLTDEPLESIADLYAAAAAYEQEVQQHGHVQFTSRHE